MRSTNLRRPGLLAAMLGAVTVQSQATFDWSSITPNEDLVWHDCYDGVYKCARLEVPYDYNNESDTRTMAIAMQMLPAVVPADDPTHGGSVFLNPGGPGHPGTEFVMTSGQHLQLTFDKAGERHHDIIGWDTRGVGETTPKIKCLDGLFDRDAFYTELRGTHAYEMNRSNVAYMLAMYESLSAKCVWQADNEGLDIWEYVSTVLVVEDLVRMVDKLEEERPRAKCKRDLDLKNDLEIRQTNETSPARLQYYGVSYGTVIGQFFASIHPERVGRIVIDGVVDVEDYLAERVSAVHPTAACSDADYYVGLVEGHFRHRSHLRGVPLRLLQCRRRMPSLPGDRYFRLRYRDPRLGPHGVS